MLALMVFLFLPNPLGPLSVYLVHLPQIPQHGRWIADDMEVGIENLLYVVNHLFLFFSFPLIVFIHRHSPVAHAIYSDLCEVYLTISCNA